MKRWIVNNLWIKAVSLILAIITWFYVNGELDKQKRERDIYYKPPTIEPARDYPSAAKQLNKGYVVENK